MKKLNATEASHIIGGCEDVCESKYTLVPVTGGLKSCQQIVTCTDKHGTVTSQTAKEVAPSYCQSVN